MDKYGVAAYYRTTFARLQQHRWESTYEYFERFRGYMDDYPNHGLQLHELLRYFLNGMRLKESKILDTMAGGSIMDHTPTEVWYLIQERAAVTRPYTESDKVAEARQRAEETARLAAQIAKEDEEFYQRMLEKQSQEEQYEDTVDEDIIDEELQVVSITSIEDVPTEEEISSQYPDIIIEQNTVIACNPIIPHISNPFLPSKVQNDTIQKALRNNQVWGSLEKITIHIPTVRNPMRMQNSKQFLDSLCINWKTQKKGENTMQSSLGKVVFHTHMVRPPEQTPKLVESPEGLHRTWKRRKKGKCTFVDKECSMFSIHMQKSHSSFGWKPGLSSWRNISHRVTKKSRRFWTVEGKSFHQRHRSNRRVKKFDGVHPWSPNI